MNTLRFWSSSSALVSAALLLAGCGGGGGASQKTAAAPDGRTLFVQYCGGCHTLAAAGTNGTVAKDLDKVRPTRAAVLRTLDKGTRLMKPHFLPEAESEVVADYVARVAR